MNRDNPRRQRTPYSTAPIFLADEQRHDRRVMTELIDRAYFQELAHQPPEDVCHRALCRYDEAEREYILPAWGDDFTIDPHGRQIGCVKNNERDYHEYFHLFIIYYLLRAKEIEARNEWISEKDMDGGPTFFRGPHEIPTNLITRRYENDIEKFRKRCEQIHGSALDMADAAYRFTMAPRIPIAVLYWRGDDEFPAEARILYDRTITEHLTLDIVFALAVAICTRIGTRLAEDMI